MTALASADTPRRTAAAFAFGVFLSFSPFLGLQILIGMTVALALRLSRVAVFAGLCTNLPWLMLPWYSLTTFGGAVLLRAPVDTSVAASLGSLLELPVYQREFWAGAAQALAPFFWSFVIGSVAGAAVVALLAYVSVVRLLEAAARADVR